MRGERLADEGQSGTMLRMIQSATRQERAKHADGSDGITSDDGTNYELWITVKQQSITEKLVQPDVVVVLAEFAQKKRHSTSTA